MEHKKGVLMEHKYTVAEARRLRNVSQEELAKAIGVSIGAYRNKEKGESKWYFDEADIISSFLGFSMNDILFTSNVAEK